MTDGDYISMGMHPNGRVMLRVQVLRWLAKLFRIQFKIGGIPYGASFERAVNHAPFRSGDTYQAVSAAQ